MTHRTPPGTAVAAVDIGTQTCRLAIVRLDEEPSVLVSSRQNTRLGEGLFRTGALAPQAMQRTLEALADFQREMEAHGVTSCRACGTAALRMADNADAFLARSAELGLRVDVLSGDEEAALSAKGLSWSLPEGAGLRLGIDIGGGSTEFLLIEGADLLSEQSLDIGAVTLTERFLKAAVPTAAQLSALHDAIRHTLAQVPRAFTKTPQVAVGMGGTATTLAAMDLRLNRYDAAKVRGHRIPTSRIAAQAAHLSSLDLTQRQAVIGLEPKRADIIIAGMAILLHSLDIFGLKELTVTDGGLLLGLLISLIEKESDTYAESSRSRGLYL